MGERTKSHTTSTTTTYTFDQAGEMTSAGPSGHRSTYSYDGLGNEAAYQSQGASTKTQLIWANPQGSLTLLYSNGSDYFVYGPGITPVEQYLVATAKATFLNYGGQDGMSSYVVTKTTGKLTKAYSYGAYGTLSGTAASVFGYAGEYTDSAGASPSGLVNMRARWYQPTTGTFMRADALSNITHEPYVYAGDNPIVNSDPTGEATVAHLNFGDRYVGIDVQTEFNYEIRYTDAVGDVLYTKTCYFLAELVNFWGAAIAGLELTMGPCNTYSPPNSALAWVQVVNGSLTTGPVTEVKTFNDMQYSYVEGSVLGAEYEVCQQTPPGTRNAYGCAYFSASPFYENHTHTLVAYFNHQFG
jgi:RHS repeat-associated protein